MTSFNFLRRQSIGKQYGVVFSIVMLFFISSVIATYFLLDQTSDAVAETESTNDIVVEVNQLMSIYQEKYAFIPEYIIDEDEGRLLDYLALSSEFTEQAKRVRELLTVDDHIDTVHHIIDNNHRLDEYYFSDVVPNVQQINTDIFTSLQQDVSELRDETLNQGDILINGATTTNRRSIEGAQQFINTTVGTLIGSIVISLILSILLVFWISRRIRLQLGEVVATSDHIANGQLDTDDLSSDASLEIYSLSNSINRMKTNLKDILGEVSHVADTVSNQGQTFVTISNDVASGSEQVASTIEELANGATSQADEASAISEKTKDFNERIQSAQANSNELVHTSESVLQTSDDGYEKMNHSLQQMNTITKTVEESVENISRLEKDTQEIGKFVEIITGIAEQTNLLALNASIEAARAGESGKGFAVVAEEVRKLAEEVHQASDSITSIVQQIQSNTNTMVKDLEISFEEVNKGRDQMDASSQQFDTIRQNIHSMSEKIDSISSVIDHFEKASADINQSVENIAAISEESAAGAEEISASAIEQKETIGKVSSGAHELQTSIEKIEGLMKRFSL
ncbi:methyl-accepting chemotaxis protein [Pelagirhabdus alkalitolerans]|uniref:Methyl-accepting chemotaxis protein n=1 Tax=Pelagirhabdus alkalitolerans TaxID=1612202 RepID=A0A1G6M8V5_9BACI|nr:HAMP domain-containing methyl-accepting chemotaxis protein [Pelagirhabdus alkalitolerans]SDC51988.1 methyl-accepting chemotaxis protein [Pelagirhabdus alkalitolerans]